MNRKKEIVEETVKVERVEESEQKKTVNPEGRIQEQRKRGKAEEGERAEKQQKQTKQRKETEERGVGNKRTSRKHTKNKQLNESEEET